MIRGGVGGSEGLLCVLSQSGAPRPCSSQQLYCYFWLTEHLPARDRVDTMGFGSTRGSESTCRPKSGGLCSGKSKGKCSPKGKGKQRFVNVPEGLYLDETLTARAVQKGGKGKSGGKWRARNEQNRWPIDERSMEVSHDKVEVEKAMDRLQVVGVKAMLAEVGIMIEDAVSNRKYYLAHCLTQWQSVQGEFVQDAEPPGQGRALSRSRARHRSRSRHSSRSEPRRRR